MSSVPAIKLPSIFLLLLLLFSIHFTSIHSWKKEEFRPCNEAPFCKRTRSRKPHTTTFTVSNLSALDGKLKARLHQNSESGSQDSEPIRPLLLELSVYRGGIMRLKIDEDYNLRPDSLKEKTRFQVQDVLLQDLDDMRVWIPKVERGKDPSFSTFYIKHGFEAVVKHNPFEIFVRTTAGDRVLSINSHGLFDFEQLREKKEEETWEERFRSHTDTRPNGPQSISFDVSFYGANFVYGIPQHASTSLPLQSTIGPGVDHSEPYRLFNLDVFEYLHESPFGIYGSIPFMMAHGRKRSSGFFWLNAAEMQIDVLAEGWDGQTHSEEHEKRIDTVWMSEAGIVDAFFFVGPEPKEVVRQYTSVTGTQAMPPQFAMGYHQCRWNYRDEADVYGVDAGFDDHDIPYDVLWLDIEHTDGKRYFTWDKASFPNPVEMQNNLAAKGRQMVTIVDPHIKRDESFSLHKEFTQKGYYTKDASGKDFDGWCWPGSSSYPDMLNPEIREWWEDKFSLKNYVGSTPSLYIWNDMNEPSVFNGPELTMPRDLVHYGGVEHREMHNLYGFYFQMASSNGLLKRGDGKIRPFVLTRAFFAGSQRYGAMWTGDNTADWDHLKASVPMVLTIGLTGFAFSGADIGGFFGNPGAELLVRWYQLGSFYPFFRAHAHHDSSRREPWLFGERSTALIREAIHVRYSLLPYYYTLFREASVNGSPVMRPLWYEFPSDTETFTKSESFMIGNSILVQGIYIQGQKTVSVYLPGGQSWYDLRSGVTFSGGMSHDLKVSEDNIPSFQKAGTIIPKKERFRRSSTQMVDDPYTLVIALNDTLSAEGEIYIDDGKSFEYEQGAYIHSYFLFSDGILSSTNIIPTHPSKFSFNRLVERIVLLGIPSESKRILIESARHDLDMGVGPLTLRTGSNPVAFVIKKPNVSIGDDWSLRIL